MDSHLRGNDMHRNNSAFRDYFRGRLYLSVISSEARNLAPNTKISQSLPLTTFEPCPFELP